MAATQEKLDALEDAISQGVLEVEYSDKRVKYRTLNEMIRIANRMKIELGIITPGSGRRVAEYKSGLRNNANSQNYIDE
jgi:hypothetical protein